MVINLGEQYAGAPQRYYADRCKLRIFFKKPPVSAKNQRNIVLTRPVETKNQKLFGGVAKDSYLCRGFRGTSRKAAGKDAAGGDMRK